MCYHSKFGRSGSNVTSEAYAWSSAGKMGPSRPAFQRHSRSLELTRIDRPPMSSSSWSLVTVGLSRTVSGINGSFGWKSQNFPVARAFNAPHWQEFCNGADTLKPQWCPDGRQSLTISSFIYTQYRRATDRQTDRTGKTVPHSACYACWRA